MRHDEAVRTVDSPVSSESRAARSRNSGSLPDYIWRLAAQEAAHRLYALLKHVTYVSVSVVSVDRKPNAGMLLDAAEHFQTQPRDMLYIGDMETDHQAAVAAGCHYQNAAHWLL